MGYGFIGFRVQGLGFRVQGLPAVLKITGPLSVMDYITAPNIEGYQNGALILGTTHVSLLWVFGRRAPCFVCASWFCETKIRLTRAIHKLALSSSCCRMYRAILPEALVSERQKWT